MNKVSTQPTEEEIKKGNAIELNRKKTIDIPT